MSAPRSPLTRVSDYAKAGFRRLKRAPVAGPSVSAVADRCFAHFFVPDLQLLHDTLAETELNDRYWVWAGMLLGYAREGKLLAHDRDADFGILPDDVPSLLALVPRLRALGFTPIAQYYNNAGELTELTFRRHWASFEFFVFRPVSDRLRYTVYGYPPADLVEVDAEIQRQPFVPFDLAGRTWLKPADHEQELAAMYGEWRVPQRGWNYLRDDAAIVSRRPWTNTSTTWRD